MESTIRGILSVGVAAAGNAFLTVCSDIKKDSELEPPPNVTHGADDNARKHQEPATFSIKLGNCSKTAIESESGCKLPMVMA
jgi:hypothetical protein